MTLRLMDAQFETVQIDPGSRSGIRCLHAFPAESPAVHLPCARGFDRDRGSRPCAGLRLFDSAPDASTPIRRTISARFCLDAVLPARDGEAVLLFPNPGCRETSLLLRDRSSTQADPARPAEAGCKRSS